MKSKFIPALCLLALLSAACGPAALPTGRAPQALAVESFLANLAQHVAGERQQIETLIPLGLDPHAFEPTPQDVVRIANSPILIVNGAGFEAWLSKTLDNAGGQHRLIEASAGLTARLPQPGETGGEDHAEGDPHFWLDPSLAIRYVENIRDGLSQADPDGKEIYARNTAAYIEKLQQLDGWIKTQIETIPPERRLMVTNHESFGYYADRYGLRIVGAILPGTSSLASPSANQLAGLIQAIQASQAPAIFLETGSNPELADQLAAETGVQIVTDLYTHSLSAPGGPAASYIEMMRYNTTRIMTALAAPTP